MEWFGFWIFAAACVWADAWLYSKGHSALLFEAKTDEEKAIQHREAYGVQLPPRSDPREMRAGIEPDKPWPRA